ncbi:MAG: DNA-3-methyladenine glycosylase [Verrucomicrobia bacterium]|nr:DNA-3-methyladenine glycosylase [Verrucomicrobiota bacterium]
MDFTPLPASFYEPSAERVAPQLLGHFLVRRTPDGLAGGVIVETEGYLADDPSCHGFRRETARNHSMYGPPGRAYVYFIYGNYYCFNAVCCRAGVAEAVLLRAVEPAFGEGWMRANRPVPNARDLTSGPAKFCLALDIGRTFDGVDLCSADSAVFIGRNPEVAAIRRRRGPVITTTRVGLSVAEHWPLRFYLAGSEFVSKRDRRAEAAAKRSPPVSPLAKPPLRR